MIYYVTIGIIGLAIIGFFVLLFFEKKRLDKIKNEMLDILSRYGNIDIDSGKTLFKFQNHQIEVLFFTLKSVEELVVNSRVMWEIFRANKAMLIDQTEFLKSENYKWIIIYPSISRIKRYINENEMVFIKHHDQIYDYQLILWVELEEYLEDMKNGI